MDRRTLIERTAKAGIGTNRGAGETPTNPKGKRYALHHMLTGGNLGLGAWRDGGLTVHDLSDPTAPSQAPSGRTTCTRIARALSRAKS